MTVFLFQYYLGSEVISLQSSEKYNDGQWHIVSAKRVGSQGVLELDVRKEIKSYKPPGGGKGGELVVCIQYCFYFLYIKLLGYLNNIQYNLFVLKSYITLALFYKVIEGTDKIMTLRQSDAT